MSRDHDAAVNQFIRVHRQEDAAQNGLYQIASIGDVDNPFVLVRVQARVKVNRFMVAGTCASKDRVIDVLHQRGVFDIAEISLKKNDFFSAKAIVFQIKDVLTVPIKHLKWELQLGEMMPYDGGDDASDGIGHGADDGELGELATAGGIGANGNFW